MLDKAIKLSKLRQLHDVVAELSFAFQSDPLADGLGLLDGLDQFLSRFGADQIRLVLAGVVLAAIRTKTGVVELCVRTLGLFL